MSTESPADPARPMEPLGLEDPGVTDVTLDPATGRSIIDPETGEVLPADAPQLREPGRVRRFWRSYGVASLLILFIVVAWQVGLRAAHVPKYELPVPSEIFTSLKADWSPYLRPGLWITLIEMVLGFLLAAALGVGLAVLLHLIAPVRRAIYPLLISSQTIPIVVVAPILVILSFTVSVQFSARSHSERREESAFRAPAQYRKADSSLHSE